MFTGLVSDLGQLQESTGNEDRRFRIATSYPLDEVAIGASIACNGCCLSVVEKGSDWFAVDVSGETLSKTTLGNWQPGQPVNLERALRLGDELGGHLVSGHVDGMAQILEVRPEGESLRFSFRAPEELARYIAPKGCITLDGVSLTVNEVEGTVFGVNIIPHTAQVTTFGRYETGDRVNLEIDLLARYVARLMAQQD